MIDHALEVLEFQRTLEQVAHRAASEAARDRLLRLRPRTDTGEISRELARVDAVMGFVGSRPEWAMHPVPEVRAALARLGVEGASLESMELHRLGVLMTSSRLLAEDLRGVALPELGEGARSLLDRRTLEESVQRCVDPEGRVLDSASRELERIRDRLRGMHTRIVRTLERYLAELPERFVVPDASVTIREGRYVIPVRREGRREVGGIMHDESQTGATVYMEPPNAIQSMNELRELEQEEAREVRRILREMTARLAAVRTELDGAFGALVDFDTLQARARTALAWGGSVPELVDGGEAGVRIVAGGHPLLIEDPEIDAIPFDLDLGPDERAVVVTGPNTGGKSVFLKAVGLISSLAQSGVVPPVGVGTRLPVFHSYFADIGDEQSIARSLSTFSAHLANLGLIVRDAGERSLVLIDEMGTGTDPSEGAALARAVLEHLVGRGARAIVSSHLGDLKRLDAPGSGIINASLEFDEDLMAPTYRVVKGRPGRSYGLAIARRLGFPTAVLDRAEAFREDDDARMEELLGRLERREREADRLVHELESGRAQVERLRVEMEGRERAVAVAERTARERARVEAHRLLMDSRAEVEAVVSELRRAAAAGEELDDAVHEARRRVEAAAARRRASAVQEEASGGAAPTVRVGDRVRMGATGGEGRVMEVRADRALVEAGVVRVELSVRDLEVLGVREGEGGERKGGRRGSWRGPETSQARWEVDLRGMRVDEMGMALARALDQAVLEDLSELRIIHGKGTGALRQRVGELLAGDPRVVAARMGGVTEGGAGVTVATLREGA